MRQAYTALMLLALAAPVEGNAPSCAWAPTYSLRSARTVWRPPGVSTLEPQHSSLPRGSIAVLDLGLNLPTGVKTAHAPAAIAAALREGGFGVAVIHADELADPHRLTPANFDAVVLPYGPLFPAVARAAFTAYLKAGGSFLSTDGYAFDRPIAWNGSGWNETTWAAGPPMNTRTGKAGDAMDFSPEQIGTFDPAFTLDAVRTARGVGTWADVPFYRFSRPPSGFSACALIGDNSPVFPPVYRRWIPVLEAHDAKGEVRGTALSVVNNFAGVYRGSSWAVSGLTSGDDLFLGSPARKRLLWRVIEAITRKVFLRRLRSDLACYRSGEMATLETVASNFGRWPAKVELVLRCAGSTVARQTLTVAPGASRTLFAKVRVNATDYVTFTAEIRQDRRVIDRMESAYCAWSPRIVAHGPHIGWKDNYLTVDGHARFLCGTNQTGMVFYSEHEGPAAWDRDLREMAHNSIHILRILHFSPFAARGYEGRGSNTALDLRNRPERLKRQLDAIVQLAQKHGIALFLALHDWMDVALTDEELREQADWDRFWASRYRDVPGIFFDVQNEPAVDMPNAPHVLALWNRYLEERYGSDSALHTAWWKHPPDAAMPNVPLPARTDEWDDVRTVDLERFKTFLLNRWVRANVAGVKAGNPKALVTVGYLPTMDPADKILGTRYTDFSNMHFYGSLREYPLELKLIDRRFRGKGFSLGEFGAQEAHDARTHGQTGMPVEPCIRRFQAVVHYAAGMGAAFVANWDWKEFDEMVFPWGLVQRGDHVPKPWLTTFAQEARFLASVEPFYDPPSVYLLVPDSHRLGPRFGEIHRALQRSVELLLDQRVNFGVLNENDLDRIPPSAKAIAWPIPYCPEDRVFERVVKWVRAGGSLYLSGDVVFDSARRPTKLERRTLLGVPTSQPEGPFDVPERAWSRPIVQTHAGNGHVVFAPYPLELKPRPSDGAVYALLLDAPGVRRINVRTTGGRVRALSIPTRGGGTLYTLIRADEAPASATVTLPAHSVSVDLSAGGCCFVAVDGRGNVVAAESDGKLVRNGKAIASADGHFGLVAQDGKDLSVSRKRLLLPHLAHVTVTGGSSR